MSRGDLIPSRGAVSEPLYMEVQRELTREDLFRLDQAPKVSVPILQKLRATHHRQAQLLAQGKTPTEVAAIVGCTVQRLVQLQVDPTFVQLLEFYKDQVMVKAMEDGQRIQAKMVDLGEMAVDELIERLEDVDKRKQMSTGNVRQIAEFAMDRTVAPPKAALASNAAPTAVTINFGTPVGPPPGEDGKVIEGNAMPEVTIKPKVVSDLPEID